MSQVNRIVCTPSYVLVEVDQKLFVGDARLADLCEKANLNRARLQEFTSHLEIILDDSTHILSQNQNRLIGELFDQLASTNQQTLDEYLQWVHDNQESLRERLDYAENPWAENSFNTFVEEVLVDLYREMDPEELKMVFLPGRSFRDIIEQDYIGYIERFED